MQPGPYGAPPPPVTVLPTPAPSGRLTPSGWWYVVAAAFGIGGVVLAIVLGVAFAGDYSDRIDDFDRVEVPGTESFRLEAGDYTIYQEYFGADDDFSIPPDVSVNVTGPDGDSVGLDEYRVDFTYAGSGHEGVALFTFEAEETGEYQVSAEGDSTSTIAIGEGIGMALFVGIALALASAFGGIVICAVIAIVVAVKRSGSKTRRQLAMIQQGGWRPPPGTGGWPQQPQAPTYGQPPYGYQQPPYGYQQPHRPPPPAAPTPGWSTPSAPGTPETPGTAPTESQESPSPTPPPEHQGYQPSAPTRSMPPTPDEAPPTNPPPPPSP